MTASDTPRTDAQLERDGTLVSAGMRIAEWRDLCFELERELQSYRQATKELPEEPKQLATQMWSTAFGSCLDPLTAWHDYAVRLRSFAIAQSVRDKEEITKLDEQLTNQCSITLEEIDKRTFAESRLLASEEAYRTVMEAHAKTVTELQQEIATARAEERESLVLFAAAKAIIWYARWAAGKMRAVNAFLPHTEVERFRELEPQMEQWLLRSGAGVGVCFSEADEAIRALTDEPAIERAK